MDDAGVTEFAMNRLFYDMVNNPGGHAGEAGYHRRQDRFLVALEGRFLDSGQWRAYYQRGHSDVWYTRDNNLIPARFNQDIDVIANHEPGGVSGVEAVDRMSVVSGQRLSESVSLGGSRQRNTKNQFNQIISTHK